MKTRLLLGMLLASLGLSACSKTQDDSGRADRDDSSSDNGAATKPAEAPKKAAPPSSITLDLTDEVRMKLVLIPAGEFMMGAEAPAVEVAEKFKRYSSQESYYLAEHPRHKVAISKPFYMGRLEVTRPQWTAVMGTTPWKGRKCDRPEAGDVANHVSWELADKFCKALAKKTGRKVSLPTEAQWEYACRAGTESAFSFGDDDSRMGLYAWYAANTLVADDPHPHTAGRKPPNRWGLYDMHGNASEWCRDWYDAKFYEKAPAIDPENTDKAQQRVLRGGQWDQYPDACRSAFRAKDIPTARKCGYGFRVVTEVEPVTDK